MNFSSQNSTLWLFLILILGFILRVGYALAQDPLSVYQGLGGDSGWYLANGWGIFSGEAHGWIRGVPFYVSEIPTAPLYLLFVGLWQQVLDDATAVIIIRLLQCLMSIGTVVLAVRLSPRLVDDVRVGLITAFGLSFHPAFIIEPAFIANETLYIFLLILGLWIYVEKVIVTAQKDKGLSWRWLAVTGMVLGLATLTRAVLLLFPLGLAIHLLMVGGRQWRRWLLPIGILLVSYSAMVSLWTVYNLGTWDRFVIGSNQMMPAIWRGAVQNDGSPEQNDALLIDENELPDEDECQVDCKYHVPTETYVEQIGASIGGDIVGYLRLRLTELAESYLQPHGTVPFGDASLKDLTLDWLRNDRSVSGLGALVQAEGFVPKLIIYLFHYSGIVFGLLGMWLTRNQWRLTLPLIGFILYTTLIHVILLALPRYIFPTEVVYWVFASMALLAMWKRVRVQDVQPQTV